MKSMIDKKNKLWKWRRATKKEKVTYKKQTGLELEEIGVLDDKIWDIYSKLWCMKRKHKGHK